MNLAPDSLFESLQVLQAMIGIQSNPCVEPGHLNVRHLPRRAVAFLERSTPYLTGESALRADITSWWGLGHQELFSL